MATESNSHYGMLAIYETPGALMEAAKQVRDAGYRHWDVYSPYPIHGMNRAMGLKNSRVGWFTFFGGLFGFAGGMFMIWYMNGFDYQLVVGGKPFFSPIYAFPISFECTILFGAFGTMLGLFYLNKLPRLYHPLLKHERFHRTSHDGFCLVIQCTDARFTERETRRLLKATGGKNIEWVED